jgi:ATP-dependent DNA helicase RecG
MLARLSIQTVGELVQHFPRRHLDLSHTASLADVEVGGDATVVGTVHDIKVKRPRRRLAIVEIAIVDGTGALVGVWFNQPYMADRFEIGERVAFAGRVTMDYGLKQMRAPHTERVDAEDGEARGRILPVHGTTEGLTVNWMRRLVLEALKSGADVVDPLPVALRREHGLVPRASALWGVHFPESQTDLTQARRRLVYEELLLLQLALALRRAASGGPGDGVAHTTDGPALARVRAGLPFALTGDQVRASDEILADMAGDAPMGRMLLGDVGTGKTAVAALALAAVHDSGTQAAMMAPTEVLAEQYSHRVGPLLDAAGVPWVSLTGSTSASDRAAALRSLADGSATVALGTHALFSEDVRFSDLTLAVVDEQHRFGVRQRLALREKGHAPDVLVMTATPIPRSLALTIYGDLDTSYLRDRPSGRSAAEAVRTRIVPKEDREEAYGLVRQAVRDGRQAYVICPLVEESEDAQAKAATREADRLARDVFPDLEVALLTGRTPSDEKRDVMEGFRDGRIDVLVATTVVEVGVDVPEAVVMIVEGAERFGLAQLHQLRGRVSRGPVPGTALLFADPTTDEGRARMDAVASIADGFELAEEDLRLRGEGQLLGERQSGLPDLRIASVVADADVLETARRDAWELVAEDPGLASAQHLPLRRLCERVFPDVADWMASG